MSRRARSRAAAVSAKHYASATSPAAPCNHCNDGDGHCVYPYYGQAMPGPNFRPDPDVPGCGTFTHCPQCGAGEHDEA